ncbi:12946_t:CDS:2 [Cetraspora pellucida]|uniref:12946_t:CDS:1 n=1 Tax=Cetraspora pellucida TaxID=1433469 RepID=A0ACA9KU96_9GLOM|nr:12946_t:CDS:2 [Cetraspora pellucida]
MLVPLELRISPGNSLANIANIAVFPLPIGPKNTKPLLLAHSGKIVKEGEKVKSNLNKARKEYERESAKKHFHKKVDHWLSTYQTDMKYKGISLQDKDLSLLDELTAEICGEQKPESPEPEQQLAEKFLKKLIEAELYLARKQSNPQIVSELLQLKKENLNIYQLLNKEGRVDKVITKLQELEKNQKNNQQVSNNNSLLLPGGVGKSTLARALAHEASQQKLKVLLADLEIFSTAQQALREASKYDLTIIDGPARTSHATLEIAQKSDLVIQPAGPSLDDLVPAVKEFHALVQAGVKKKKLIFALNRIATPAEEAGARKYLSKAGYSVLTAPLLEKTSYRQAQNQGLAITEVVYMGLKDQAKKLIQEIIKKNITTEPPQEASTNLRQIEIPYTHIVQKENVYLAEVLERMMLVYQKEGKERASLKNYKLMLKQHNKFSSEYNTEIKRLSLILKDDKKSKQLETLLTEHTELEKDYQTKTREITKSSNERKQLLNIASYTREIEKEETRLNTNSTTHNPRMKNFLGTGGTK